MVHEKNFSRLGMDHPGQTLVDWAWVLQGKTLVDWAWDLQSKQTVDWEWGLLEKQLLLSVAMTRAAGGCELKTGEEELLSMQELR